MIKKEFLSNNKKYIFDGIQLEDGKSISSFNIRKESPLILIQQDQITVKTISGKLYFWILNHQIL